MTDRELKALMAAILIAGSYAGESSLNFSQAANYARRILAEIDATAVAKPTLPECEPEPK